MDDILTHHGILGQKWGVRRYQNADGSLTPAGRERYGVGEGSSSTSIRQLNSTFSGDRRSRASSSRQSSSSSGSNAATSGIYGGGGSVAAVSEAIKEEEDKFEDAMDELEDALLQFFDGNSAELHKYVTISRDLDNPSNSMFIVRDPITKTQTIFRPNEGSKMMSYLSKKFSEAAPINEAANKRNAAAQKQDAAKKAQELARKTAEWQEAGKRRTEAAQKQDAAKKAKAEAARKRTEAAQKQDAAKKAAELKEAARKRTEAAQKQDRAIKTPIENARKRTEAAQKQDAARKAAEKAARNAEFLAKEAEKIRILKEKGKELEAQKRTEAAQKQDAAKKKNSKKISHSEWYDDTNDILVHFGVLGMKWGIRRYQNEDGTLTEAGKERVRRKYSKGAQKLAKYDAKVQRLNTTKNYLDEEIRKQDYKANRPKRFLETWKGYEKRMAKANSKLSSLENAYRKADWKSEKMYNKGAKWAQKMSRKFSNIDISSVDKSDIEYLESYLSAVLEDKRRASHNSSRRSSGINARSSRT